MLASLALALSLAAGPADRAMACEVSQGPVRVCPIRAEALPAYTEEYDGADSLIVRRYFGWEWLTVSHLRLSDEGSSRRAEYFLDEKGYILKVLYYLDASDPAAGTDSDSYVFHDGRLDSVITKLAMFSLSYVDGRLDSISERGIDGMNRYEIAYDADGLVESRFHVEADSAGRFVRSERTEYAYHWPDSVNVRSYGLQSGDTTFRSYSLREGRIRKVTVRIGRPGGRKVVSTVAYWYAGESPGSAVKPRVRTGRMIPRLDPEMDALGRRLPWAGPGASQPAGFRMGIEGQR